MFSSDILNKTHWDCLKPVNLLLGHATNDEIAGLNLAHVSCD